jgi:N-acetylglucosaminyl-diphospho-decaprenol L-rhamnosyltransferase
VSDAASLAIVIVTYNVRDEIAACLASLDGGTSPPSASIIVVDNASTDGTSERVRQQWPHVRVIDAGDNLGFARANNVGIRAASSDFVLLLNPDTIVRPGAIRLLIDELAGHPEAAAAGPRLVDRDGVAELSFGWTMSPMGELRQRVSRALYYGGVVPFASRIERWTRLPGEREWLSGACLLVRRSDLESVGLLDERYFMYTEDVDLCVALRRRGRTIRFVPAAEVLHLRGRSALRNPHTERLRRQSQLAYYAKHHPAWAPILKLYLRALGKKV